MPKTPSDKLYRLIRSLSGSEKRYFKLAVKGQDSKYVQLFDAINAQETFDDEVLKRQVYGARAVQSRKYSELKAYLFDHLVKILQQYDESSVSDYRLAQLMAGVQVLFRRAHYQEATDQLQRARKLAERYEDFSTILKILSWEKEIAYARTDINQLARELPRIEAEEQYYQRRVRQLTLYRNIFFRLLTHIRKGSSYRKDDRSAFFSDLISHKLLEADSAADSYRERVLFYRIHSIHAYATLDWQKFHEDGKRLLTVLESNPAILKEEVSEYISALSNFVVSCSVLGSYTVMRAHLERFQAIRPQTTDDRIKIHRQYYLGLFEWSARTGEFEEGMTALRRHRKSVSDFPEAQFNSDSFHFYYFYLPFGHGDYEAALDALNRWINLPQSHERADLQSLARIVNLIIHYELDNQLLLDSLIRSARRFLKKQDKTYEFEQLILELIAALLKQPDPRIQQQVFADTRARFVSLQNTPTERAMLRNFDVMAWLDSKIENTSFASIIRRNYAERETRTGEG